MCVSSESEEEVDEIFPKPLQIIRKMDIFRTSVLISEPNNNSISNVQNK